MKLHLVPTRIKILGDLIRKFSKHNPELFVPDPEQEEREIQRNKEALVPEHLKALRRLRSSEKKSSMESGFITLDPLILVVKILGRLLGLVLIWLVFLLAAAILANGILDLLPHHSIIFLVVGSLTTLVISFLSLLLTLVTIRVPFLGWHRAFPERRVGSGDKHWGNKTSVAS